MNADVDCDGGGSWTRGNRKVDKSKGSFIVKFPSSLRGTDKADGVSQDLFEDVTEAVAFDPFGFKS